METYKEALEVYFSNKEKYEKKVNKAKSKILSREVLSKREKQEAIKNMKIKCISCKRNVNTIFINTPDEYRIKCGDKSTPCDLNVHIKKCKIVNGLEEIERMNERIKEFIIMIISLKHDILYDLKETEQQEVVEEFERIRNEYNELLQLRNKYIFMIENQTMEKERMKTVQSMIMDTYLLLQQFKQQLQEGFSTKNISMIKDTIVFYKEEVKPMFREMEEQRYAKREVVDSVFEDSVKRLLRIPSTTSMYHIQIQEPNVVSLKI